MQPPEVALWGCCKFCCGVVRARVESVGDIDPETGCRLGGDGHESVDSSRDRAGYVLCRG